MTMESSPPPVPAQSQYLRIDADVRSWMVCESEQRWLMAVRRFATDIMEPWVPQIQTIEPAALTAYLKTGPRVPAIALWEVRNDSLLDTCDSLTQIGIVASKTLVLFVVTELSARQKLILGEYGCAAMIRHPEELPKLRGMIQGYFAAAGRRLD
jgi:hypothetical protein